MTQGTELRTAYYWSADPERKTKQCSPLPLPCLHQGLSAWGPKTNVRLPSCESAWVFREVSDISIYLRCVFPLYFVFGSDTFSQNIYFGQPNIYTYAIMGYSVVFPVKESTMIYTCQALVQGLHCSEVLTLTLCSIWRVAKGYWLLEEMINMIEKKIMQ